MAAAALVLEVAFGVLAFGARSWVQWRRTGDSGFRRVSSKSGAREVAAAVLFAAALVLLATAPVAELAGAVEPADAPAAAAVAGVVLACAGIVGTLAAQMAMGSSWRIGVDAGERTDLVTGGVFSLVRNPIFTAMAVGAVGLALMVPNVVALAAVAVLAAALELQVRGVEEPYLASVHGRAYIDYASRVGRFLPGLGKEAAQP